MSSIEIGRCDKCGESFHYYLIHNGFNDTQYAYCDTCGCTAFLECYSRNIPAGVELSKMGRIDLKVASFLSPCGCGGHFTLNTSPRCPHCYEPLSAVKAAEWVEANAPGTAGGWRWQNTWDGMYCIVVEDNRIENPWIVSE